MSTRGRGERNWEGYTGQYSLHKPFEERRHVPTRQLKFTVEEIEVNPPSFHVHHESGALWVVTTASDGELEVLEQSSEANSRLSKLAVRAVTAYLQKEKTRA
jgi:hypothetical protein